MVMSMVLFGSLQMTRVAQHLPVPDQAKEADSTYDNYIFHMILIRGSTDGVPVIPGIGPFFRTVEIKVRLIIVFKAQVFSLW